MSQILGLLILAAIASLMVSKLGAQIRAVYFQRRILAVERIAVEEYRRNRPIDRVQIIADLVGDLTLAPMRTSHPPRLEADDKGPTAFETARVIGSVRVADAMTPCDAVTSVVTIYTGRDLGDENDAKKDAQSEGSNDLHLATNDGIEGGCRGIGSRLGVSLRAVLGEEWIAE